MLSPSTICLRHGPRLGGLARRIGPAAIRGINVVIIAESQTALYAALDYLQKSDYGHLVVIHRTNVGRLDVRYVDPPPTRGVCQRQHGDEHGSELNLVEVGTSFYQPFTNPAVLWRHPGSGNICHTNYDIAGERTVPGNELTFSFGDCVPKWRVPIAGDYVLSNNATSGST